MTNCDEREHLSAELREAMTLWVSQVEKACQTEAFTGNWPEEQKKAEALDAKYRECWNKLIHHRSAHGC